VSETYDS